MPARVQCESGPTRAVAGMGVLCFAMRLEIIDDVRRFNSDRLSSFIQLAYHKCARQEQKAHSRRRNDGPDALNFFVVASHAGAPELESEFRTRSRNRGTAFSSNIGTKVSKRGQYWRRNGQECVNAARARSM